MVNNKLLIVGGIIVILLITSMTKNEQTTNITTTGNEASGVEIYFTDAPLDNLDYLDVGIEKIELVGQKGTRTILSTQTQLRLQDMLVQKVAGETILKDQYQYVKVYFMNTATATMNNGEETQISVRNRIQTIPLNAQIDDDEIMTVLIDIPLDDSVVSTGDNMVFEPNQIRTQVTNRVQNRAQIRSQVQAHLNIREQFSTGNDINMVMNKYQGIGASGSGSQGQNKGGR